MVFGQYRVVMSSSIVDFDRAGTVGFASATRLTPSEVCRDLAELLGSRLVAYIGGVQETRAVRQWAEGARKPPAAVVSRLRFALQVTSVLVSRDSPQTAQAWFQGMNPALQDAAPARLLREESLDVQGPLIMAAAREFAQHG